MNLNEFEKAKKAYGEIMFKNLDDKFIENICQLILKNKKSIKEIYDIEQKYDNFCDSIENILNHIQNNMLPSKRYNAKIEQRKNSDGFIVGKCKESIGVLGVIFDGNPYITIELALKAIMTKNAIVFCTNNNMYAITELLVLYFQQVLEENGYTKDLIQVVNSTDYIEMFNHNTILNKLIVIGDKDLQNKVVAKSNIEVITSGYNCFDLYIEDILDKNLIQAILDIKNIELNIYINSNISREQLETLGIEIYTEVENVEECIRDININSAGYSSSIFASNGENANKFLKLVKSKNVFSNASPTIERSLDIDENDLLYMKKVILKNK